MRNRPFISGLALPVEEETFLRESGLTTERVCPTLFQGKYFMTSSVLCEYIFKAMTRVMWKKGSSAQQEKGGPCVDFSESQKKLVYMCGVGRLIFKGKLRSQTILSRYSLDSKVVDG